MCPNENENHSVAVQVEMPASETSCRTSVIFKQVRGRRLQRPPSSPRCVVRWNAGSWRPHRGWEGTGHVRPLLGGGCGSCHLGGYSGGAKSKGGASWVQEMPLCFPRGAVSPRELFWWSVFFFKKLTKCCKMVVSYWRVLLLLFFTCHVRFASLTETFAWNIACRSPNNLKC